MSRNNVATALSRLTIQRCYSPVASYNSTLLQCRVLQFNVATMSRARRQQRCHSKNGTWQRRCHNVNVFVGLQSVFTGKAQEAYSSLSVEDAMDYLTVKNAVLRAYELVPEAYRQFWS